MNENFMNIIFDVIEYGLTFCSNLVLLKFGLFSLRSQFFSIFLYIMLKDSVQPGISIGQNLACDEEQIL